MKKICYIYMVVLISSMLFLNVSLADDYEDEIMDSQFCWSQEIEEAKSVSAKISNEPQINSKVAVIYDRTSNKVIWGKNENQRTAMASTTKIMTAIIVIENCELNKIVTISKNSAKTRGSRLGLNEGDTITVNDLLYGLMLRSGNDAAVALAETVGGSVENFANLMNSKAKSLGLVGTNFVTPHGLDDENHYTTAAELARIADYALENQIFKKIVGTKNCNILINGNSRNISNTNELLGNCDGVYGVKTGFTFNSGRCLVSAINRDNIDIICVVLQADTKKDRTKDSLNLIEYAFQNFQKVNIKEFINKEFLAWKEKNISNFYIKKSRANVLQIEIDNVEYEEIMIKNDSDLTVKINAIYNFEAPIDSGEQIGELNLYNNEEIKVSLPIRISNKIERKELMDYLVEILSKYK